MKEAAQQVADCRRRAHRKLRPRGEVQYVHCSASHIFVVDPLDSSVTPSIKHEMEGSRAVLLVRRHDDGSRSGMNPNPCMHAESRPLHKSIPHPRRASVPQFHSLRRVFHACVHACKPFLWSAASHDRQDSVVTVPWGGDKIAGDNASGTVF